MIFKVGTGGEIIITTLFEENYKEEIKTDGFHKVSFKGKLGESFINISNNDCIAYLSLGKKSELTTDNIRTAFYKLSQKLNNNYNFYSLEVNLSNIEGLCRKKIAKAVIEGFLYNEYKFDKYISEKKENPLKEVLLNTNKEDKSYIDEAIKEITTIFEGIILTRDLINTPAMYMYPQVLADTAKDELEKLGVKVTVLDKDKISEIGMEAFLAVSRGSSKEPKFIILEYKGDSESDDLIAYVGKGLTYDSGGYSIKPTNSMKTMQSDMSGAATVIGAIKAIASAKLKKNIVGIIAACENMISGDSYKPGDIINSLAGKTIEIGNTDAEGRLTLADALYYTATEYKPNYIVDLATLTGACVVALGDIATGAVTNNEDVYNLVKEAIDCSDEKVWLLPSFKEYKKYIKSEVADLSNVGKIPGAGTITAGLFLEEFVNKTPWVHLDIAGTAYLDRKYSYYSKGATGYHVKALYYLAKECKGHK